MQAGSKTDSDAELLQRVGAGDALAIASLYDRYAAVLLSVALRILGQRAEAEDVVHDAFVLVGERAGYYVAARGSVATWLVTLARNLSIDRKRRRDRRGAIHREVLVHEPTVRTEPLDPESNLTGAAEQVRLRRALSALPESQRTTLERAFFEGLSYPEIAEIEMVPLGTVKSRAARAIVALREALLADSL
jgi:RNA polymerase sigma-70 factor (ECF subfamily)